MKSQNPKTVEVLGVPKKEVIRLNDIDISTRILCKASKVSSWKDSFTEQGRYTSLQGSWKMLREVYKIHFSVEDLESNLQVCEKGICSLDNVFRFYSQQEGKLSFPITYFRHFISSYVSRHSFGMVQECTERVLNVLKEIHSEMDDDSIIYEGPLHFFANSDEIAIFVDKDELLDQVEARGCKLIYDRSSYSDYICVATTQCLGELGGGILGLSEFSGRFYHFLTCPIRYDVWLNMERKS